MRIISLLIRKTNKEITMTSKTYSVKGNRTAADVLANREETIGTGIESAEEARRIAICAQKFEGFTAAWVEEEVELSRPERLAAVVIEAKAKTIEPKWRRAIDRASAGLLSGELIVTTLAHGALVTSPNGTYQVNGKCECKAAQNGHRECYHRAAVRLVEMMEAAPGVKNIPENIPERETKRQPAAITRSIAGAPSIGAMWFAVAGE
jgi:hypothetical protein